MRLRKVQGKLKVEHSIIDGVRSVLERLLAGNPGVRSVIPGATGEGGGGIDGGEDGGNARRDWHMI